MDFTGFGKSSGPAGPPGAQNPFNNLRPPPPSFPRPSREVEAPARIHPPPMAFSGGPSVAPFNPTVGFTRSNETRPIWGDRQNILPQVHNTQTHQRPSFVASRDPSLVDLKRSRSPPSQSSDENLLRNSRTIRSYADVLSNDQPTDGRGNSFNDSQWPTPSLTRNSLPIHNNVQTSKRTRSPPFPSTDETSSKKFTFIRRDTNSSSASPSKFKANPEIYPQSSTFEGHENPKITESKATNFPVAKKTKLPSFVAVEDDMTRESLAKAKRLARFKDELSEPAETNPSNIQIHKVAVKRQHQYPSIVDRQKVNEDSSMDISGDLSNSNVLSEYEGSGSSTLIVGSCPDMCPGSERAERERKGDLDQYERVDGDRNQTSMYLAVKKYTRTAEREAQLIRPMPILQKTMDYLLNLLDQAYDEKFLGLYNFLWDRMRAIRMDLRMQHIFDQGAISMLEQMIRLHIIAMHELCEYTKGEGFAEGFDAHLNIEQMNKTSVELFQLYDDHRKKEIHVPTEKEFRGYYALLKLDKHPGYKVEPAELSLDLAKMTPDMRQTQEVVFARDVARACRTGNFISFFRLARKASYLQACLMHAHFAKLRTQALAALHSGLQNNQGIPITHVSKWLGMEEEDIETLVEYHGFVIKDFEEPYMVKEGVFLNVDNDYPVKCSKLVHTKKATTIFEDASSPSLAEQSYSRKVIIKDMPLVIKRDHKRTPVRDIQVKDSAQVVNDDNMPDYETVSPLKDGPTFMQTVSQQEFSRPLINPFKKDMDNPFLPNTPRFKPIPTNLFHGHDTPHSKPISSPSQGNIFNTPSSQPSTLESIAKPRFELPFVSHGKEIQIEHQVVTSKGFEEEMVQVPPIESAMEIPQQENISIEDLEDEETRENEEEAQVDEVGTSCYDEEVAIAKLKLILRLWKRWSLRKKKLREQKQLATNAALSLLSLGPPICQNEANQTSFSHFSIDKVMSKRYEILESSWSKLNVSEVIASKITEKNPDAKCLCWKIVVCCQEGNKLGQTKPGDQLSAGSWLISKLIPPKSDDFNDNDGLIVSSNGVSIWSKWLPDLTNCLSVVKDVKSEDSGDDDDTVVAGANAILFVLSEWLPYDLQKDRLHNLVMSLPSDSHLPLLILSGSCEDSVNSATIVEELHLHGIDQSRVSSVNVAFLRDEQMKHLGGVFSDERLRNGLQWLASESPKQPVLRCVKTRQLIVSHLNTLLKINSYKVDHPDQCISLFNEAIDQTMRDLTDTAKANRMFWPCPEIGLLEESSNEYRAVASFLPNIGWSSADNISTLVHGLNNSKLPFFSEDISWLYKGSHLGSDIEEQSLKLENCLIEYLSQSSQMMGVSLAMKEARVVIQKCAKLELHDSVYYIIPNWEMIFRLVFNWRLMSLSKGAYSSAYISIHRHALSNSMSSSILDMSEVEDSEMMMPYHMDHPSLDEMVQVSCSSIQPRFPNIIKSEVEPMDVGKDVVLDNVTVEDDNDIMESLNKRENSLVSVNKSTQEADRLTQLLDKCSIMQNMIDKKLGIYF